MLALTVATHSVLHVFWGGNVRSGLTHANVLFAGDRLAYAVVVIIMYLLGKVDFMEMTETENGKGKWKHTMLQRSHAYLISFNNNLQPGVFSSAIHASTKAGVFFVSTQNNCSSDLFVEYHSISVSVSIFISVKSVCPVCCIVQLICCLLWYNYCTHFGFEAACCLYVVTARDRKLVLAYTYVFSKGLGFESQIDFSVCINSNWWFNCKGTTSFTCTSHV